MTKSPRRTALTAVLCVIALPAALLAQATQVKPGFNIFSEQQDVDIGRQSAAQAERQLPLLNDPRVENYAGQIIRRLAAAAPGAHYPYQIRVVNASDINAFSLPGGFMYVNRGLIEAARREPELAAVLAHEMAHVALRHGTHQASKAYMTQAGIGILGGLLGRGGNPSQVFQVIGGLGLNALFLKFSRDDEYQADTVGAQIMARAGYDPRSMADFFQVLRNQQKSDPGRLATFFSDHPAAADRETRIRPEAQRNGGVVDTGNGQQSIIYGVIVNHYDPFQATSSRREPTLDQATQDLVTQITQSNSHLRPNGSRRRETIDGAPALSQVLSGRSPVM